MSMRTLAIALVSTLAAGMALGQDALKAPPKPDYSRPTLMRLFVEEPQISQPRFDFDIGQVTYHRHGLNLMVGYLPLLAPFPGTVPTTTRQMIDPFAMTHTQYATPARIANAERERQLRQIERLGRGRARTNDEPGDENATVKVTPP
jgi:hypothetical protein